MISVIIGVVGCVLYLSLLKNFLAYEEKCKMVRLKTETWKVVEVHSSVRRVSIWIKCEAYMLVAWDNLSLSCDHPDFKIFQRLKFGDKVRFTISPEPLVGVKGNRAVRSLRIRLIDDGTEDTCPRGTRFPTGI